MFKCVLVIYLRHNTVQKMTKNKLAYYCQKSDIFMTCQMIYIKQQPSHVPKNSDLLTETA
jgi:hypothetical protein